MARNRRRCDVGKEVAMEKCMLGVKDIRDILGVSDTKAYALIRGMNDELKAAGYIVVAGKVPRAYWETKFYSGKEMDNANQNNRSV